MKKILILSIVAITAIFGLTACTTADNSKMNTSVNNVGNNSNMTNVSQMNVNKDAAIVANNNTVDNTDFATKAAQGGMAEVKLGELAAKKAQNPDVKAFAKKMVEDHGKANAELKDLAAKNKITLPTDMNQEQKDLYEKLSKTPGADFDKLYVNTMVDDHDKDLELFKDQAENSKDANLKAFAAKYAPVIESHYKMIQGIQDKMK